MKRSRNFRTSQSIGVMVAHYHVKKKTLIKVRVLSSFKEIIPLVVKIP